MKQKTIYQQITPKANGAKKTNGHALPFEPSEKGKVSLTQDQVESGVEKQDNTELIETLFGEPHAPKLHKEASAQKGIPQEVAEAFAASDEYFPTDLQKFQYFDKYSRFDYEKGRRETWIETVDRSVEFLKEISQNKLPESVYQRVRTFILEMKATPSMRLLAMAGTAARVNNICIYNCSYLPVDSIDSWVESLIISMSGCGVGYSVEKKYVSKLPVIARQTFAPRQTYVIEDSTQGWANAVRAGLTAWYEGRDMIFDFSQLRPAGAPLKTKGGRSSGPEPLRKMLEFARARILNAQGRQLNSLEAHDIMCEVGNAAVSGGMRRTAMISLFDWDDLEMRNCKNGDFEKENSQRWNANNSAVWPDNISDVDIMRQMLDMVEGQMGEPGIFSREVANKLKPDRRKNADFGTNPCGEISLRPYQFCNLSISIARSDDTPETLKEKVEVAAIIGTIQSMATYFPGLREMWKHNGEEERLLGVDITGQLDCPAVQDPKVMEMLKQTAIETNKLYSQILGINQSASVTCVKPSGNSSQLFNCSSGLHARWSPYYIRNVRVSSHSPIFKVLKDAAVPMDPENGQTAENANTWVVHFPVKSPAGAKFRTDRTAIEQCEYWLMNKQHWTEHNPSVTITYKPDEVMDLIKWVVEHKDYVAGMAFLPSFDSNYAQLPYIEIDEQEYNRLAFLFPPIDFSKLYLYEHEDLTTAAQELACVAGACEVDYDPVASGISANAAA
jgi:ribonucleoside-triphosphate reductase (thioredoxin)